MDENFLASAPSEGEMVGFFFIKKMTRRRQQPA